MLRALGYTMAAAMHKAAALSAGSSTARLSATVAAAAPRRVTLPSSLSPISQPWWRSLSSALSASSAASKPAQWSRRSFAVRAEGEGAAPAAEPTEEAAPAEEAPAEEAAPPKTKALTKQVKHIMNILNQEAAKTLKAERNLPDLRPGDVVAMKVEVPENKRRVSLVRGIVIAKRNAGVNSTFRIRRIMAGVGVEMVFPLYSPNIKEIKVVDKRRARRAKLYYLRDKIARLSTVN